MAKRRKRGGGDPLIRQAQNLSTLRFGPELGALSQLLSEAKLQRRQAISGAVGGARHMTNVLQGLRPQIDQTYQNAQGQRGVAQQEADAAFAGLSGPVVEAIRAASARERLAAANRATTLQQGAQNQIGERITSTQAGAIGERRLAEQRYGQDVGKIGERLKGIGQEQGAFLESTLQDLTDKQRAAALDKLKFNLDVDKFEQDKTEADLLESERAFRRRATRKTTAETRRHNEAMENKGGKGKGGSSGGATPETIRNAHRDIRKGYQIAKAGGIEKGEGHHWIDFLTAKKGFDPLLARAAVSYAIYGRIDTQTRRDLQTEYGIGGVKRLRRRAKSSSIPQALLGQKRP